MGRKKLTSAPPLDFEKLGATANEIASAIVNVNKGMRAFSASRLTRKAIIVLLHSSCQLPMKDIGRVLDSIEAIEKTWLKPLPKQQ